MLDKIADFGQQNQQGESSKMNGSQICIRKRNTMKNGEEGNTAENDQRSKRRRKNNEKIGKIHQLPNNSSTGKCEKFTVF
jgi:hypothetical protein